MKRNDDRRLPEPVFETDVEALDYIEEATESMLKIVDTRGMNAKLGLFLSQVLDEVAVARIHVTEKG